MIPTSTLMRIKRLNRCKMNIAFHRVCAQKGQTCGKLSQVEGTQEY